MVSRFRFQRPKKNIHSVGIFRFSHASCTFATDFSTETHTNLFRRPQSDLHWPIEIDYTSIVFLTSAMYFTYSEITNKFEFCIFFFVLEDVYVNNCSSSGIIGTWVERTNWIQIIVTKQRFVANGTAVQIFAMSFFFIFVNIQYIKGSYFAFCHNQTRFWCRLQGQQFRKNIIIRNWYQ